VRHNGRRAGCGCDDGIAETGSGPRRAGPVARPEGGDRCAEQSCPRTRRYRDLRPRRSCRSLPDRVHGCRPGRAYGPDRPLGRALPGGAGGELRDNHLLVALRVALRSVRPCRGRHRGDRHARHRLPCADRPRARVPRPGPQRLLPAHGRAGRGDRRAAAAPGRPQARLLAAGAGGAVRCGDRDPPGDRGRARHRARWSRASSRTSNAATGSASPAARSACATGAPCAGSPAPAGPAARSRAEAAIPQSRGRA